MLFQSSQWRFPLLRTAFALLASVSALSALAPRAAADSSTGQFLPFDSWYTIGGFSEGYTATGAPNHQITVDRGGNGVIGDAGDASYSLPLEIQNANDYKL